MEAEYFAAQEAFEKQKRKREKRMNILGIDIGTTSICVVVYDAEHKKLLMSRSLPNAFLPGTGFLQDADEIVRKVRRLLEKMEDIPYSAIGISSQMHGIVYADAEGNAVTPLYTWKNEYAKKPFRDGESFAGYLARLSGYPVYAGYGSATHFYLQQTGGLPAEAEGFVDIGDYLAMRLTGNAERRVNESMAAGFGCFDRKKGRFDFDSLKKAGADVRFYPEICSWKEPAGFYNGKPVFHALGDNQASFLAAVRSPEDGVGINVGTGSQVSVFSEKFFREAEEHGIDIRPFPGGGYLYVGASLNGGKVYERLAAFFSETCRLFTGSTPDVYEKMRKIAGGKEETDLKACPDLYGTRGGGEETGRSGFWGLTESNFHPADLIRSYVRGMAEELKGLYEKFPEKVREGKNSLTASGNGLRKNPLLCEEIRKTFGMELTFSEFEEESAAGAAIFAEKQAASPSA